MKVCKSLVAILLAVFVLVAPLSKVEAAAPSVKWGKIVVQKGVVGKVTIVKDTTLYKIEKNTLKTVKKLVKGTEHAVYGTKMLGKTKLYTLVNSTYVKVDSTVKYAVVPKDILAKLNPAQPIWSTVFVPGIKFGMTQAELEKLLKQKPEQTFTFPKDKNVYVTYSIPVAGNLKKLALNNEKSFKIQFRFDTTDKLVSYNIQFSLAKLFKTSKELKAEQTRYINSLKSIQAPTRFDSQSEEFGNDEMAYWENNTEIMTLNLYYMVADKYQPESSDGYIIIKKK